MEYVWFLADVDGALVTHEKVLTDAAKAAARDLREAEIPLAITSGRPPRGMRMLVEPLALATAQYERTLRTGART